MKTSWFQLVLLLVIITLIADLADAWPKRKKTWKSPKWRGRDKGRTGFRGVDSSSQSHSKSETGGKSESESKKGSKSGRGSESASPVMQSNVLDRRAIMEPIAVNFVEDISLPEPDLEVPLVDDGNLTSANGTNSENSARGRNSTQIARRERTKCRCPSSSSRSDLKKEIAELKEAVEELSDPVHVHIHSDSDASSHHSHASHHASHHKRPYKFTYKGTRGKFYPHKWRQDKRAKLRSSGSDGSPKSHGSSKSRDSSESRGSHSSHNDDKEKQHRHAHHGSHGHHRSHHRSHHRGHQQHESSDESASSVKSSNCTHSNKSDSSESKDSSSASKSRHHHRGHHMAGMPGGHGSHGSHKSHGSHGSHKSHGSHGSHKSHGPHGSHKGHRLHGSHKGHGSHGNHKSHGSHKSHSSKESQGSHRGHHGSHGHQMGHHMMGRHRGHYHGSAKSHGRRHSGSQIHIHLHIDKSVSSKKSHKSPDSKEVTPEPEEEYSYARCDVHNNDDGGYLVGTVFLRQKPSGSLEVKVDVGGFDPSGSDTNITTISSSTTTNSSTPPAASSSGLNGFHVHEFADFSRGCASFGGHYDPAGTEHGGPGHDNRHAGDWGNIQPDAFGNVDVTMTVEDVTLFGSDSIAGRGIVIHAKADDLGEGDSPASKTTGDAGARLACCVISWMKAPEDGIW